jgi:hypothetical protein
MAISDKSRSTIVHTFRPQLGEEATREMLALYDLDLVTTEHLDQRLGELRTELRTEMAELRIEMHDGFRRQTMWLAGILGGTVVGGMGLAAGIAAAVANAAH